MNELEKIIQKLQEEGASEEDIAAVVQEYEAQEKTKYQPIQEPTSFGEGVMKSITSGEALGAGLKGALGFAKGATIDIPSSIGGAISSVLSPIETIKSIPQGLRNIAETTMRAGTEPEEFGRMMGQMTGQAPLLGKAVPMVGRNVYRAGPPIQATGEFFRRYQPISNVPPRWAQSPTAHMAEYFAGRGIEKLGKRISKTKPEPVVEPFEFGPAPEVTSTHGFTHKGPVTSKETALAPTSKDLTVPTNNPKLPPSQRISIKKNLVTPDMYKRIRKKGYRMVGAEGDEYRFVLER